MAENEDTQSDGYTSFKTLREGREGFIPGWYDRNTLQFMAESFKNSADVVVINRKDVSPRGDTAFWPAAYLYRHAHELILKVLYPKVADLAGTAFVPKDVWGHDLKKLWLQTRSLVCHLWKSDEESAFPDVDAFIADLQAVDPSGDAFRYETARDGSTHLSDLPHSTSIDHFARCASKSFNCLSGVLMGIDDAIDTRNDMLSDFRSEMNHDCY